MPQAIDVQGEVGRQGVPDPLDLVVQKGPVLAVGRETTQGDAVRVGSQEGTEVLPGLNTRVQTKGPGLLERPQGIGQA